MCQAAGAAAGSAVLPAQVRRLQARASSSLVGRPVAQQRRSQQGGQSQSCAVQNTAAPPAEAASPSSASDRFDQVDW